jgi:hypothetical protein
MIRLGFLSFAIALAASCGGSSTAPDDDVSFETVGDEFSQQDGSVAIPVTLTNASVDVTYAVLVGSGGTPCTTLDRRAVTAWREVAGGPCPLGGLMTTIEPGQRLDRSVTLWTHTGVLRLRVAVREASSVEPLEWQTASNAFVVRPEE